MKLIDYITGNRKGREARRIEREAMDDPFLHDALGRIRCGTGRSDRCDPANATPGDGAPLENCRAGFTGARRRRCCCAPAREDTC